MNNRLLLLLAGITFFSSCKVSKDAADSLSVKEAYWYNWSGGQPGVGGTNYEVHLIPSADKEVVFDNLIIDDEELSVEDFKEKDGVLVIYVSVNKSRRDPEMAGTSRPDFRTSDPAHAMLTGTVDGQAFELEIENFEKKPNKNMQ